MNEYVKVKCINSYENKTTVKDIDLVYLIEQTNKFNIIFGRDVFGSDKDYDSYIDSLHINTNDIYLTRLINRINNVSDTDDMMLYSNLQKMTGKKYISIDSTPLDKFITFVGNIAQRYRNHIILIYINSIVSDERKCLEYHILKSVIQKFYKLCYDINDILLLAIKLITNGFTGIMGETIPLLIKIPDVLDINYLLENIPADHFTEKWIRSLNKYVLNQI